MTSAYVQSIRVTPRQGASMTPSVAMTRIPARMIVAMLYSGASIRQECAMTGILARQTHAVQTGAVPLPGFALAWIRAKSDLATRLPGFACPRQGVRMTTSPAQRRRAIRSPAPAHKFQTTRRVTMAIRVRPMSARLRAASPARPSTATTTTHAPMTFASRRARRSCAAIRSQSFAFRPILARAWLAVHRMDSASSPARSPVRLVSDARTDTAAGPSLPATA